MQLSAQQAKTLELFGQRSDGMLELIDVCYRLGSNNPNWESVQASYSRTLRQLVEKGLLESLGRGAGYQLTPKGKSVAHDIARVRAKDAARQMSIF